MSFDTVTLALCSMIFGFISAVVVAMFIRHRRRQQVNPAFRSVLITGCDRGFGFLLARRLDAVGFKVFAGCLHADGDAAKELDKNTSDKLEILQLNVTKDKEIENARNHITNSLGGTVLWALVNNAGVAFHAEFEWFPADHFGHVMEVNFMGVVKVTRAFLPLVRASTGRVINMASMAARTALPGFTAYSASKAALTAFSDSLRREMAHFGVQIIIMEPAVYKTDLMCCSNLIAQNEEYWEGTDPGIKRDYGNSFFLSTQNARKRITGRANPRVEDVVEAFMEAISSRHPRTRYVTPFIIGFCNDAMNCIFLALQDYVVHCVMGIWSKPDMMNPQLHTDSGRSGRRRSHAT